jgi:hypothetical protein
MTKKDFFRLVIKIYGLYLVISIVFSVIPGNIAFVVTQADIFGIVWLIVVTIVIILLFMFLIFKPDKIIGWLKLEKGFDDDRIDFQNLNGQNIVKLAVIVIGGIMFIQNIAPFLSHTLFAFKSAVGNDVYGSVTKYNSLRDYISWATSFLNIVLGYLMVTNYNFISKIVKEKDKEENKTID